MGCLLLPIGERMERCRHSSRNPRLETFLRFRGELIILTQLVRYIQEMLSSCYLGLSFPKLFTDYKIFTIPTRRKLGKMLATATWKIKQVIPHCHNHLPDHLISTFMPYPASLIVVQLIQSTITIAPSCKEVTVNIGFYGNLFLIYKN